MGKGPEPVPIMTESFLMMGPLRFTYPTALAYGLP